MRSVDLTPDEKEERIKVNLKKACEAGVTLLEIYPSQIFNALLEDEEQFSKTLENYCNKKKMIKRT